MDPDKPWANRNYVSRNRSEVLARAGSRYAPSAPCSALTDIADDPGPFVFIGKPCDAMAASALRKRDADIASRLGLILTFFCAGTPSTRGTLDLVDQLGVDANRIDELHYRGNGWPGQFRVISSSQPTQTLSYQESWGRLTSYRPLRCNLCPDGLGRVADLSCGDAWDQYGNEGDPGRSLVLVRTERGRALLHRAHQAGYVTLKRVSADNVLRAQPSLLGRRRALFGRLVAFRLLGVPIPRYQGFFLFRSWRRIGALEQFRTVVGTLRRIIQRDWFKRRAWAAMLDGINE
jgi:coenzyme F420 hydrogenase subunit beta